MKRTSKLLLASAFFSIGVSTASFAEGLLTEALPIVAPDIKTLEKKAKCTSNNNATLRINFKESSASLKQLTSFVSNKTDEIMVLAQDLNIEDLHIQTMSYNIQNKAHSYRTDNKTPYSLNGSVTFATKNTDKAASFAEVVDEKGFNINFRVSTSQRCR